MVSTESILENFRDMGIEPSKVVLDKCYSICLTYNVDDAEEFVEQWMAFSLSKFNGQEPTVELLNDFERKEFTNRNAKDALKIKPSKAIEEDIPIYNNHGDDALNMSENIMDAYNISRSSKASIEKDHRSGNTSILSPASFSPIIKSEKINISNSQSNKVVITYGQPNTIQNFDHNKKIPKLKILTIPLNEADEHYTPSSAKCFLDKLIDKCAIEENRLNNIGLKVCAQHFNTTPTYPNETLIESSNFKELTIPGSSTPHQLYCVGRICCDSDGRMNEASTLLIGHDSEKLHKARLNLSAMPSVSVFPGQIVLVRGKNADAEQLHVETIFAETQLQLPKLSNQLLSPINVIVAAGPFSYSDDLSYKPFETLLEHCKKSRPNVLILIGPFLDPDNKMIVEEAMAHDYNDHFENMIKIISEAVGDDCQILVGASCNDVRSYLYPTPPDTISKTLNNVHLLPDPCMVDISGITIGMTSVDVLQHLLDEEVVRQPVQDKIKRTVNYLFNQRNFYPLHPPRSDLMYDSTLAAKHTGLNTVPNILIVPGAMRCFVRDLNNCLVVNPGHLANNNSDGTFATLVIRPVSTDATPKLNEFIACQVVNV